MEIIKKPIHQIHISILQYLHIIDISNYEANLF